MLFVRNKNLANNSSLNSLYTFPEPRASRTCRIRLGPSILQDLDDILVPFTSCDYQRRLAFFGEVLDSAKLLGRVDVTPNLYDLGGDEKVGKLIFAGVVEGFTLEKDFERCVGSFQLDSMDFREKLLVFHSNKN